jgi:hypothetical protein
MNAKKKKTRHPDYSIELIKVWNIDEIIGVEREKS